MKKIRKNEQRRGIPSVEQKRKNPYDEMREKKSQHRRKRIKIINNNN
jgi:hypothetical protein